MTTKVGSSVLSTTLTGLVSVSSTTFTGTTFAGNLNGTWSQLPAGTVTNFFQAAAPTGWTQRTDLNDFMMYIVSGTGGGSGGSASPILNNTVPYHTHGFTTGWVSADHSHGIGDPGHAHGGVADTSAFTGGLGYYANLAAAGSTDGAGTGIWTGGASSNHTHSGNTNDNTNQGNWIPKYLSNIMCTKS